MLTSELRNDIDKIWNTFATGGISNPLSVIEQITYLLFIKRLDELHTLQENKANTLGQPISNPIYKKKEYHLRWSRFKDLEAEEMFKLFRLPDEGVFDFMKNYGKTDSAFGTFMKDATFNLPTPRLLSNVVDMLSAIDMSDRDTKGDVYEYLLSKIATAGRNGQFRTPRHIIKMMAELTEPAPDDIICDPSAGTCGFLVACKEYMDTHHEKEYYKKGFSDKVSKKMFMGMEFDSTMIRIGAMNMILHGVEEPQLQYVDALSEANNAFEEQASLILANPPFKGSLDKDTVDGELTRVVDSKKTELLFLALILKGLKKGGRAAVIVPDGVLFGSSKAHKQIRAELVEKHRLQAVISMPSGVFKPYAGVSTAILLFTKTTTGGTDKVWMYDMQADGLSLDDKRAPVKENDIPDILARWKDEQGEKKRKRTDKSFYIDVQEIRDNNYDLSFNRYNEVVYEEKTYDAPQDIIAQIRTLDKERNAALQQLEALLQKEGDKV